MRVETERVIIRLLVASDLDDSFEHRSDPKVCQFVGRPITRQQTKEKIEGFLRPWKGEENSKLMLAIELKKEKKLIGELMFKFTQVESGLGEIGYRLNQKYQSKGLAYEATFAFINELFEKLNLHKISASCLVSNTASWRLMEKLGMKKEGHFISHFKVNERWHDAYVFSILEKGRR